MSASDEHKGLRFTIDPAFFIHDLSMHNASSLLTSVSRHTHVRLVHTGCGGGSFGAAAAGNPAWSAARAHALAASLMDDGAFDAASLSLGDRATPRREEHERLASALLELAHFADTHQERAKRATAAARPLPQRKQPAAITAVETPLSDEVVALQAMGEDPHLLGQLGRKDRGSLKAKLKELGYCTPEREREPSPAQLCRAPQPPFASPPRRA